MKKFQFWMLGIFTISVLFVSCGKTVDESLELAEYLESADSPVNVEAFAKYITATNLNSEILTGNPYVIDIRSAEDYTGIGHIIGAVNVASADIISHLDAMDVTGYDKIVITCYTGQSAGFVTALVRIAGYDAYSLKWGMSSWNAACAGSLNSNSKNTYATQFETTDNPKGEEGPMPVIETGFKTGEEILEARIAVVLEEGFEVAGISDAEVFGNLDNYYIVNYWPVNHYTLGHVPGAVQYTPNEDLITDTYLMTLPVDKPVVVYCYTGQTSAFMAAYLRVLGYDARTLKFGVNGMATDWAASYGLTHWSTSEIAGNDLVTD